MASVLVRALTATFIRPDSIPQPGLQETALKSFYETMAIDTPEAIANLEALVESGECVKTSGTVIRWATREDCLRLKARLEEQERKPPYPPLD